MVKYIIFLIFIASGAYAGNCNFDNINFGMSQKNLRNQFQLNTLEVAKVDDASIISGAPEICEDLPETAVVEFLMMDDKLVQVSIVSKNTQHDLLKFAQDSFGKQDNTSKSKSPKRAIWNKANKYSVIYSAYNAGQNNFEKLIIISGSSKGAFDRLNKMKIEGNVSEGE